MGWWIAVALAEDATYSSVFAEWSETPSTRVSTELGGTLSTGNYQAYSVSALASVAHQWDGNRLSAWGAITVGGTVMDLNGNGAIDDYDRGKAPDSPPEAGFVPTAERKACDLRYDRRVSDRVGLYLLVGAYRDPFLGYDLRSHQQFGVSRQLVKDASSEVRVELGGDFAQEDYHPVDVYDPVTWEITGTDDLPTARILSTRFFAGASHTLSPTVGVSNALEIYGNVLDPQDARILNTAAVTSTLSGQLALRVSHSLVYDNLPVPTYGTLDQTSMLSLVVTVL